MLVAAQIVPDAVIEEDELLQDALRQRRHPQWRGGLIVKTNSPRIWPLQNSTERSAPSTPSCRLQLAMAVGPSFPSPDGGGRNWTRCCGAGEVLTPLPGRLGAQLT